MRKLFVLPVLVLMSSALCLIARTLPAGAADVSASAPGQLLAAACRQAALQAEKAQDWPAALTHWERVIDRCRSSEEQRTEARKHIHDLRPKVDRNTDPAKARSWKTLVILFRELEFSWETSPGKKVEVHKTLTAEDEKKIRADIEGFSQIVFQHSCGMLRIEAEFAVVDKPLTKLGGGRDGFFPAPFPVRELYDPLVKGKGYQTVFAYAKFDGGKGPRVPQPFIAANYWRLGELDGAGLVTVPWNGGYPIAGEKIGEMELHEWLHQIDSMFTHVLGYPDEIVPTSDAGRYEGDNRPGGDPEYGRKPGETTWIRFYQHIMEEHITRQMWSEATMQLPKDQRPPGEILKVKKGK